MFTVAACTDKMKFHITIMCLYNSTHIIAIYKPLMELSLEPCRILPNLVMKQVG